MENDNTIELKSYLIKLNLVKLNNFNFISNMT